MKFLGKNVWWIVGILWLVGGCVFMEAASAMFGMSLTIVGAILAAID